VNRVVALLAAGGGADSELRAPGPGLFHRTVAADHLVAPGDVIGELDVLGRITQLIAPDVCGLVKFAPESVARRTVGYGDVLVRIVDATDIASQRGLAAHVETAAVQGLAFRAPTSGRFYGRPSPDKPPFVTAGSELAPGTTICLLEVMKTFNRVTYSGAPVRVREVLVAEGADVSAGEPLLALEAV
jgi:acetyl-CoA carboxylase biotin carboxyl carrier protein